MHMCHTTHSDVSNDSFICVTWLTHSYVSHEMHMRHTPHSYVSNDSLKCVHMTHSCKPHDKFMCDLTRLHVTLFVMMRLEEESRDTVSRRRRGTLQEEVGSQDTHGLSHKSKENNGFGTPLSVTKESRDVVE